MEQLDLFYHLGTSFKTYWIGEDKKLHSAMADEVQSPEEAIDLTWNSLIQAKEKFFSPVLAFVQGGLYAGNT